jgi:beta-N-acetylhexosaminidase
MKTDRIAKLPILLGFVLLSLSPASSDPRFSDDVGEEQLVEELLQAMTDEELLGQVFFLGYHGTLPSADILRWVKERNLGGVKIFKRNVDNLDNLASSVRQMQDLALDSSYGIPLLIAADQEGGWVQHIKGGSSVTPGNMAIGAGGIPEDAYRTGFYLGMELRSLGINMNFAPTVDVYSNPSATVIGPRSFSSDPIKTGLMAVAYFRGMEEAGVISTAKHFPGHGGADKDSHGYLPEVAASYDELWDRDLLPYRFLIKEGLSAIMGGHLAFPNVLGKNIPSTLSPFFLQDVLRERLEFEGIIVTDDLEMYGVHQGELDLPSVSRKALEAGNDMILLSHTPILQERTWQALVRGIREDDAFRSRVREAVARILRLKIRTLKAGFPLLPGLDSGTREVPYPGAAGFFLESSCRAITLIGAANIPFKLRPGERLLLAGQPENFIKEARRLYPQAELFEFPLYPYEWSRSIDRERMAELAGEADTIIFCLANKNSLEVLESIQDYPGRLFVISTLTPVWLERVPWVSSAVAVYGLGRDSFRAGFAVLAGEIEAEGVLPVSVP